jgi:NAD(P)-dependent dehydrogenase (short-subunit alcohol dehydrogenase family)
MTLLQGRVIAITGAAQGIGKATALACVREGAAVAVCDINGALARIVADSINENAGRAIAIEIDAGHREDVVRMVQESVAAFGKLDGLVCGGMRRFYAPAESFPDEHWDTVVQQGLTGYFRCAQEAARQMFTQRQGAIVFITSTAGRTAVDGGAAYCAVKAGIAGLTRQLGVEWARRGIRTNAVAPGFTVTEGALRKMSDEEAQALIPRGQPASAQDIGNVCVFLLSDLASHITAQEIVVDGGYTVGSNISAGRIRKG